MNTAPAKKRYRVTVGTHYERNPDYKPELAPDGRPVPHASFHPDRLLKLVTGQIVESERDLVSEYPGKFERVLENPPVVVSEARRQAVGQLIQQGGWTEEDRFFLETLPDDGFARIRRMAAEKQGALNNDIRSEQEDPKRSIHGEEVTHFFSQAHDNGLRVWRNVNGKHQITQGAKMKALNPEALEADGVVEFITSYLATGGRS